MSICLYIMTLACSKSLKFMEDAGYGPSYVFLMKVSDEKCDSDRILHPLHMGDRVTSETVSC